MCFNIQIRLQETDKRATQNYTANLLPARLKLTFCAFNERSIDNFGSKDVLCQNTRGILYWFSKRSNRLPFPTVAALTTSMGDSCTSAEAKLTLAKYNSAQLNGISRVSIMSTVSHFRKTRTARMAQTIKLTVKTKQSLNNVRSIKAVRIAGNGFRLDNNCASIIVIIFYTPYVYCRCALSGCDHYWWRPCTFICIRPFKNKRQKVF